jgi:hypothetical protein
MAKGPRPLALTIDTFDSGKWIGMLDARWEMDRGRLALTVNIIGSGRAR